MTQGEYSVLWLARLHDELLLDRPGRFWNGIGSAVFSVTALTGLVVWWPGSSRWKRSLGIKWSSGWRRFNWDLHSAIGFWLFLFILMWGISGFYLGVPEPFSNFVDSISDPDAILGDRPGDIVLNWLTRLHFGRWRNAPVLKARVGGDWPRAAADAGDRRHHVVEPRAAEAAERERCDGGVGLMRAWIVPPGSTGQRRAPSRRSSRSTARSRPGAGSCARRVAQLS